MASHDASEDDSAAESRREASAIAEDLFCSECAYNLRGVVGDRCPECGHLLDALRTQRTPIPWQQRAERGRIVSYVLTLWQVTFRTRRFCDNIAHPVSYRDAQWFRWTTVALAFLPAAFATVSLYVMLPPEQSPERVDRFWYITFRSPSYERMLFDLAYADVWPAVVLNVCFLLFLAAATGLPSYFFHPSSMPVRLQNRAIAMSYYACAPIVLTFIPVGLAMIATVEAVDSSSSSTTDSTWPWRAVSAGIAALLIVLQWLAILERLVRRTTLDSNLRRVPLQLSLPVPWAVAAGLTMVGLPLVVLIVGVVVGSLS